MFPVVLPEKLTLDEFVGDEGVEVRVTVGSCVFTVVCVSEPVLEPDPVGVGVGVFTPGGNVGVGVFTAPGVGVGVGGGVVGVGAGPQSAGQDIESSLWDAWQTPFPQ